MILDRRTVLRSFTAIGAVGALAANARFAFAATPGDRRLVVIILRGALDGLAAVPPYGDKDYASARGELALAADGPHAIHDLDGFFGLHPSLANLKTLYDAKELLVFHNICSPYRDRSHFEGQNVLETGGEAPHLLQDGWLNRALQPMGLAAGEALAIAPTPPLMLSGRIETASWMPQRLPTPDDVFLNRVRALYAGDPVLEGALQSALSLQAEAAAAMDDGSRGPQKRGREGGDLGPLFEGAGKLLAAAEGPRVATLEASGWDTHVGQGSGEGQLARRLLALDSAIAAMEGALGPEAWKKTAVLMATEFGRTVHPNGSGGTDHGTGGAAFLFGGAIQGGSVKADWVGLTSQALKDGRDQPARSDLRALFKGVLAEQMGVPRSVLESTIFPDSAAAQPLKGLIRA